MRLISCQPLTTSQVNGLVPEVRHDDMPPRARSSKSDEARVNESVYLGRERKLAIVLFRWTAWSRGRPIKFYCGDNCGMLAEGTISASRAGALYA